MKEIRFHGRGGQGVVMASQILGAAFVSEGKYATSFPMFGVERRGAPVASFLRFDDMPVREKCKIYFPDCLVVFDSSQISLPDTFNGIKQGTILVANMSDPIQEKPHENVGTIITVNASRIALEEIGIPVSNTCMLGALTCATGWIALECIIAVLSDFFSGELLEKNVVSCLRGFRETSAAKW
jgi:2-oxoacid:acceptor oxidoreductase gamma subunit (pyruvate/2-ketoisovalerate family)